MRIGKQDNPFTSICTSDAESITVRGEDLCGELIGQIDFTSYFWLLVTGKRPNAEQLFFTNAMLVSLAEHGLVPSVVAARMTYAAAPEAFQGAVAAGLLGCGSVVLGSAQAAGEFLADIVGKQGPEGDLAAAAAAACQAARADRKPVPGFGHPQHANSDPRARLLIDLARQRGVAGTYIDALHAVEAALPDVIGRKLPPNINGAIPAILLDIGFPLPSLKAISILARTAGLIGHLTEEAQRPIGFILSGKAAEAIEYLPG